MDILERIKTTVQSHPIVLFMKGTPQFPMCEASACTVQALQSATASFHVINVLADPEVRAGLPRFSGLRTFPQLYLGGQWIGGSEIVTELQQSGELARLVHDARDAA